MRLPRRSLPLRAFERWLQSCACMRHGIGETCESSETEGARQTQADAVDACIHYLLLQS